MPCILNIETSTKVCSVALSLNGNPVFVRENKDNEAHSALLGVFASEAIGYVRELGLSLDAVAVSAGPGSYTGLRIGLSEAKGLCYGLEVPLIAIHSLKIMASSVVAQGYDADFYCPMIDARRMEVYAAIYNRQLQSLREISADIVDQDTYESYLSKGKVLFFGDGSEKCSQVLQSSNAEFVEGIVPLASSMIPLSEECFQDKLFEDIAYFEPFYLKEFQATIAKNKVIN